MKLNILVFLVFSQLFLPYSFARDISVDQVAKEVKEKNFTVLSEAQRVYQANEQVKVARAQLLPRLNLWSILKVVSNPVGIIENLLDMVGEVAPFLVPANWFRLEQAKLLYLGQKESFRAVWANEVFNGKRLFYNSLMDQMLRNYIQGHQKDLERVYKIVKAKEDLGGIPKGFSSVVRAQMFKLDEDLVDMDQLINLELDALTLALGEDKGNVLSLNPVDLPDLTSLDPISYGDFEHRVIASSPEVEGYSILLKVIPYIKKEIRYSFLGASKLSLGVGGGVFDSIPIPDGLGFGNAPSLRIAESEAKRLNLSKKGSIEVLKRQLGSVVNRYNGSLEKIDFMNERKLEWEKLHRRVMNRIKFAKFNDFELLVNAVHGISYTNIAIGQLQYKFLVTEDRISRLTFHGDYDKKVSYLEEIDLYLNPPKEKDGKSNGDTERGGLL